MKKNRHKFGYLLIILLAAAGNMSAQWNRVVSPSSRVFAFKQIDSKLFAGTEDSGLWYSLNGGAGWQQHATGLYEFNFDVSSFERSGDYLFAGTEGGGVCLSRNKGVDWEPFNSGFQSQGFVSGLIMVGDTLFAAVSYSIGMQPSGVYKTHFQTANWKYYGTGMPVNLGDITSFVKNSNNTFFAGVTLGGIRGSIYVSRDKGYTWCGKNISGASDVYSLAVDGNRVYAGTNNGIYYSEDEGGTWIKLSEELNGFYIDYILFGAGKIFAAADANGVIYSNDNGKKWYSITKNLPIASDYISALFLYQDNLYAAMSAGQGVWSIPLSIAGIDFKDKIPTGAVLYQNYPNPFNPSTKITFNVQEESRLTVKIYNALGAEVERLFEGRKGSGKYSFEWNAVSLPSGVYFCALEGIPSSGGKAFRSMIKMVYIK